VLWDVLGFPGSFPQAQSPIYFDRTDVKKAIHAPLNVTWSECSEGNVFKGGDKSAPSGLTVLPNVIEKSVRTVVVNGLADYCILAGGTRLAIQKSVPVPPYRHHVLTTGQHDVGRRAGLPDADQQLKLRCEGVRTRRWEHARGARADVRRGRAERPHGPAVFAVERDADYALSTRAAGERVGLSFRSWAHVQK
jgi:hypothetical protein